MRGGLFSCVGLLWAVAALGGLSPVMAQDETLHPSSTAVKSELTSVIEGQLAAFRANDFPKAYTFAAREIQEQFPVESFEAMVRAGYPVIAESKSAEYGLTLDAGDEAVVTVRVVTGKRSATYQYHLKKQEGIWKIAGVGETEPGGIVA